VRHIGCDLLEYEIVVRRRLDRHRKVGDALVHERQRALVLDIVQYDPDRWMLALKLLDRRRQGRAGNGRQRGNGDATLPLAGAGGEPVERALEIAHRLACNCRRGAALVGQLQGSRSALEQPRADLALDAADRLAERGLRNSQALSGGAEALGGSGGDQDLELAKRQIHSFSLYIHSMSLFDTMNSSQ
jgi:hypothetical protein